MDRYAEMVDLRQKRKTLNEIGLKFNITGERVRQILESKHRHVCDKHNVSYMKACRYCSHQGNYEKLLSIIKQKHLDQEIERLSQVGRGGELVLERRLLIRKLHDQMGISFIRIGQLLKRDRTTIASYYHSKD